MVQTENERIIEALQELTAAVKELTHRMNVTDENLLELGKMRYTLMDIANELKRRV